MCLEVQQCTVQRTEVLELLDCTFIDGSETNVCESLDSEKQGGRGVATIAEPTNASFPDDSERRREFPTAGDLHFFSSFLPFYQKTQLCINKSKQATCISQSSIRMLLQKLTATSLALALLRLGTVNANDTFNYYGTNLTTRSFGPADWKNVTCNNVSTCVSCNAMYHSIIAIVPCFLLVF
jgi:hypothetical protein